MYYLQSRYYDPMVGRFVNGDEAMYICRGVLPCKSNLYSYCDSLPTTQSDFSGRDAIWLQATASVGSFGHTGLLFFYKPKRLWYYWYWGPKETELVDIYLNRAQKVLGSVALAEFLLRGGYHLVSPFEQSLPMLSRGAPIWLYYILSADMGVRSALAILKNSSDGSKSVTTDFSSSNYKKAIESVNTVFMNGQKKAAKFNAAFYLKGDFSRSYTYFNNLDKKRQKNQIKYNLLKLNCMQTTATGLSKGSFPKNNIINKIRIGLAKGMVIPNCAYQYLRKYFK